MVNLFLNPTSTLSTSTGDSARRFEPPPGAPPPPVSTNNSGETQANTNGSGSGSGRLLDADDLDADAPPAYTPAADSYQGESTLEVGPRRPFQQVPAQPSHQRPPPPQQQQQYLAPRSERDQYQRHTRQGQWSQSNPSLVSQQPSGSAGWTSSTSSYGGQGIPNSASNPNVNLPPPPPRHPRSRNSNSNNATTNINTITPFPFTSNDNRASEPPVSDFARDFYVAGGGDDASQSPSSSSNKYAPPSGAPPPPRPHSSNNNNTTNNVSGEEIPDDGRPTQIPTPGHPLLLNSKLLVYPVGFECHKCNNTGFKNFDPTHPCRKCWERYSRPYVGAITYTPWSNSSASGLGSGSNTNFQRPLPVFRPPQHTLRSSASQSQSQHAHSVSNPHIPPPPRTQQYAPSPSLSLSPSQYPTSTSHAPPPGSTVVRPGDPRIGGTLCYKCSGSGVVQFFIFEDVCVVCRGVGRIF